MTEHATSASYLAELFVRAATKPMFEIMCEDEAAIGNRPVAPGEESWLKSEDWPADIVVSVTPRREVRIIAIYARKPGAGAFTRLVGFIRAAGLQPVVLCPTNEFRATLKRKGWSVRVVGHGFHSEEQWRQGKATIARAALSLATGEGS